MYFFNKFEFATEDGTATTFGLRLVDWDVVIWEVDLRFGVVSLNGKKVLFGLVRFHQRNVTDEHVPAPHITRSTHNLDRVGIGRRYMYEMRSCSTNCLTSPQGS